MKFFPVLTCLMSMTIIASADDTVTGQAMARDPVTLALGGARFRLEGVLPPDEARKCGNVTCTEAARDALAVLISGRAVTCSKTRKLGHGFFLGKCKLDSGEMIAEALVKQGLASTDANANDAERAAEAAAKTANQGIWER